MRHILRHFFLLALGAIALLAPIAHAREVTELREQVRDGVKRTDKDLGRLIPRDKLSEPQRMRFDAAVKDLQDLTEGVTTDKWLKERDVLVRAVDNIDFLQKNAPIEEADRQSLGIDVYTLKVILDSWKTDLGAEKQ